MSSFHLIASRQPQDFPSLSLTRTEPAWEIDFLHLEINVCGRDVKSQILRDWRLGLFNVRPE